MLTKLPRVVRYWILQHVHDSGVLINWDANDGHWIEPLDYTLRILMSDIVV
jgi:hypothetical protein